MQTETKTGSQVYGFDHIHFWVGNALQAASFYVTRFGFSYYAFKYHILRGLETGEREVATHVLRSSEGTIFAFSSPYGQNKSMNLHLSLYGDGVKEVAFAVEDARAHYNQAICNGAHPVSSPREEKDEHGTVILASVQTYGETIHTFVQRTNYKGLYLPGYVPHPKRDPLAELLPQVKFHKVDHIIGPQVIGDMVPIFFDFNIFTEYAQQQQTVSNNQDYKKPHDQKLLEIQGYVEHYSGPGVHEHIALRTQDIISDIEALRQRGTDFLHIPDSYYDQLRKNIPCMNYKIKEDIDLLQKNQILVDYDEKGYLLQIFTKPVEDRPTWFIEVIQRNNHKGFGKANFDALFQSIQSEYLKNVS